MSLENRIGQLEQIEPTAGQCGCFDTRIFSLDDGPPAYPQRCPTCGLFQLCVTVNCPGGCLHGWSPGPGEPYQVMRRTIGSHAAPEGFRTIY